MLSMNLQAQKTMSSREMAQLNTPALPQTLPEALRLAADLAEQSAEQQARLARLAKIFLIVNEVA